MRRMLRASPVAVFLALAFAAAGCSENLNMGEPSGPASFQEPPWVVFRVDRVDVRPLRPITDLPWDEATPAATDGAGCGLVGRSIGSTDPLAGKGSETLCAIDPRPRPQGADVRFPDLVLLLGIGGSARYQSATAHDTASTTFGAEFIVPTNSIPNEGITLAVADRDGSAVEIIGGVRLGRQELLGSLATSRPSFTMQGGAVLRMDLHVSAQMLPSESADDVAVDPKRGGALVPIRPVRAGEVVEVSARGQYRIGPVRGGWIDPRGYFEREEHDPNLENEPFKSAPHGAGLTVVGGGDARSAGIVAPCARFVARAPGLVWVGLNDGDPTNNEGQASFKVRVSAPLGAEWSTGITDTACGTPR